MPIRMSGMISGIDTDAVIKELMAAKSMKKTTLEQNQEKLSWKKEKWEDLNTKIYALYTEKLASLKLEGTYLAKSAASSNSEKATATASTASTGSYELTVSQLASAQFVTGSDISSKNLTGSSKLVDAGMVAGQTITVRVNKSDAAEGEEPYTETNIEVTDEMTIRDFTAKLQTAGLNANFDQATGRFYISAKNSGEANKFTMISSQSGETGLAALGLGDIDDTLATGGQTAADATTMAVVAAKDAKLVLNGATISSSTNTITANGMTIDLKGTTSEGERITLNVSADTDGIYNKIKDFVKSYNELMKEMYDSYNAASARKYNMLTDDEKEAMTEKQVELWEDKIKGALLRNDTTLNSLMTIFRSSMQGTVEVDGKNYSLANFGIVTGVYTEHGLLHINGDSEDGSYADKEDALKKAIEQDPETTSKALSKLFSGFYDSLTKQMSASSISSALTLYNDKQIQSQIDSYQTQINDWEDRLADLEERYYKQFSSMESSLADLQSKQNQLSGLLGMS
ncbi:MAG: flagellar filament capping protein FliD [Lachnospiraceae bacterium]|nr:flagellar filament capping protein FliD [Lachnospiraceae bacterium]